jgi:glycosyltransferase involved in cell wall biosynthesis
VPLVSVVITCYNYGRYVRSAVESALAQTYADREVIVVDDGSTDNTREAVAPFVQEGRIRYVHQANAGQASAKNRGIRESRGSLIAFLDADDWWADDKLEAQVPRFEDRRVGVVYGRQIFVDAEGRPMNPQPRALAPRRGSVLRELLKDNFVPFSSAVIRRDSLEAVGGFDASLPMSIDWDLWLRAALRCRFDFVERPVLFYRQNHEGQMSKDRGTRLACCDRIYEKLFREHGRELDPAAVREARVYTYNSRGYLFRATDPGEALRYYRLSLKEKPWQMQALKGLALAWWRRVNRHAWRIAA